MGFSRHASKPVKIRGMEYDTHHEAARQAAKRQVSGRLFVGGGNKCIIERI
jgi:hypothetical protein